MALKHKLAILGAILVLVVVCGPAQAGFVEGTFNCTFNPDPAAAQHQWTFNILPQATADGCTGKLELSEKIYQLGYDTVTMSGATNSDPTFNVIKTVQNNTGFTWTGYELILPATDAATFVGTPWSNVFGSYTMVPKKVVFSAPLSVPNGGSVTLSVNINIPDSGPFGFTLTQNPVPEPATVAFLAIGSLVAFRRFKR
jgi:hypothetical protein